MRATKTVGAAERQRNWRGGAIWSRGFRPFFLGAGIWAIVAVALWLPTFEGEIRLGSAFSPLDWHAHEMIFGYIAAVVAGFLTTAIPNWTGRLPVAGGGLAALAGLWAAGRLAMLFSASLGRPLAAAIDCAFLIVFALLVAREVIAGNNRRNIVVVALVAALALADVAFHFEDARTGLAEYSTRAALSLVVSLILLIGGRVTPSFTHNWLAQNREPRRPAPFGRPDGAIMALSGVALASWTIAPETAWAGALALAAGLGNLWRLSRWRGWLVRREPLVLILHVGFGLASVGFLFAGAHGVAPAWVPYDAGVHTFAIGGAGAMTLAMMTRATLAHTGSALVATRATKLAYAAIVVALIARLGLAFLPGETTVWLHATALAWLVAFGAFLTGYAPRLVGR